MYIVYFVAEEQSNLNRVVRYSILVFSLVLVYLQERKYFCGGRLEVAYVFVEICKGMLPAFCVDAMVLG